MLGSTEEKIQNCSRDALLWLKRGLELIERFFSNVLADQSHGESLKSHIESAYAITLKQYHNWLVQKSFSVRNNNKRYHLKKKNFLMMLFLLFFSRTQLIYSVLPYRSQLVGVGDAHQENMQALAPFLESMRAHLYHINLMFRD